MAEFVERHDIENLQRVSRTLCQPTELRRRLRIMRERVHALRSTCDTLERLRGNLHDEESKEQARRLLEAGGRHSRALEEARGPLADDAVRDAVAAAMRRRGKHKVRCARTQLYWRH